MANSSHPPISMARTKPISKKGSLTHKKPPPAPVAIADATTRPVMTMEKDSNTPGNRKKTYRIPRPAH